MTDLVIERADLIHKVSAANLPADSETCGSAEYVRLDLEWVRNEFAPWLIRNKREPQGDAFRCVHFVHWALWGIIDAAYLARVTHTPAFAKAHCVLPDRTAHAVGLFLDIKDDLYVIDPQDPQIVPLADYPVLAWSRVRFL